MPHKRLAQHPHSFKRHVPHERWAQQHGEGSGLLEDICSTAVENARRLKRNGVRGYAHDGTHSNAPRSLLGPGRRPRRCCPARLPSQQHATPRASLRQRSAPGSLQGVKPAPHTSAHHHTQRRTPQQHVPQHATVCHREPHEGRRLYVMTAVHYTLTHTLSPHALSLQTCCFCGCGMLLSRTTPPCA